MFANGISFKECASFFQICQYYLESMSVKVEKTNAGGLKACLSGYYYIVDKKVNQKTYWICDQYKSLQCKGRLITETRGSDFIPTKTSSHSH